MPSVGIKTLTLNNSEEDIKILITPIDQVTLSEPEILLSSNELKMIFPKQNLPNNLLTEENIFSAKPLNTSSEEIMPKLRATAPPLGVIDKKENILPGDAGPTNPASVAWNQRSAEIPPAHIATIIIGCANTYGK